MNLDWQQNQIKMLDKTLLVPRKETIYGDPGCDYLYSGSVHLSPKPWTEELQFLKEFIESLTGYKFHIVIGNLYRDGQDSIGWHSDSEPSMGLNPAIASVTLGATRKFSIRQKVKSEYRTRKTELHIENSHMWNQGNPQRDRPEATHYWLEHGSLLIMHPGCQEGWVHQVPKTKKPVGQRINLTFRPHLKGEP
ncbi:alpha-ketoglutarate-dependent dioxygenase AlkB [Iningainema tapete]|uniref:alpha-ketoglutarate-dependent dioxygenase AlkB family protein n=1 Tax=Iningainema tapete TaxID=2806730 RepID=UPI001EE209F3